MSLSDEYAQHPFSPKTEVNGDDDNDSPPMPEDEEGLDMTIEDESVVDNKSINQRSSIVRSHLGKSVGPAEVEDELLDATSSPIKNMRAMGHIGLTSFSSHNYNRTEKSSNTNKSIRSNSLA